MCVCVCLCLCVCVYVCPLPRLLITSGIMWHDMNPYNWLNKFYSCYMATIVFIMNGEALALIFVIETKSWLALYKALIHCNTLIWPITILVKRQTVENTPYSAVSLAILAFSSAENFTYVPSVTVPFTIMVSTTGFISSLIASICEEGMVYVKDPLELGKTASPLPRLLSFLTHWSTLKYLNSATLLMPKVNISR